MYPKRQNLCAHTANCLLPLIAARVSHMVGNRENPQVYLIMHAMGPNLAGVFGTAISGGILLALLGVK